MYNVFIQLSIIILSILTILVESEISGENFSRFAQASTIINDKLYIIGGQPSRLQGSNDVFYLDLTKSFDVQSPQWIKTLGLPLETSWASAVAVKENGILLYVGYTWSLNSHTLETSENSLYTMFNTTTEGWTIPTMSGTPPERRRGMKIVSDNSNKIYVFGGVHLNDSSQGFKNMYILSTLDYSWQLVQMNNGPLYPRAYYTATMLPSGVIIYIGGSKFENGVSSEVDMSEITIFDTKDGDWYNDMHAGGEIINGRNFHSAVLTSDVKVIIYGGVNGLLITASPVLAILDTNTLPYTWSSPQIPLQDRPPPLMLHTADIYKNYMIVAFGNISSETNEPTEINSNIYILNTNTYTWITSYSSSTTTSDSSSQGQDSLGLILGIVSAVIAFLVIAGAIGMVLYKRRESGRNAIATPGTSIFEEEEGGGVMANRDSMINRDRPDSIVTRDRDSMITNGSNDINAAVIDNSIRPPSRPPSSLNNNLSSPYNLNRPSTSIYVPRDGIGPNNPPYRSRR